MSAFILVDVDIQNPEEYETYKSLAKPIAESYGGTYRTGGGELDVRETDLWSPTRIVIVEFPTMEQAKAFIDSDEYAPVQALRHIHAKSTLMLVEGV